MRYLALGLLCSTLFCGTGASASSWPAGWPHEIIDAMDGKRLVLFLSDEDIAVSPAWMPATDSSPPMSVAEMLEELKAWMVTDTRYAGAEIHEIELKSIYEHESEHRWYYLVQLRQRHAGKERALYAAVLFSGKVVPVMVEPESIK